MILHLSIMLVVMLLCLIPRSIINRKKIILPISFILIGVFFAIRYDYGLDYWSYYRIFYGGEHSLKGTGDPFFYWFMSCFSRYHQFIIAHTIILIFSLYHVTKLYCTEKYYYFFFFLFMIMGSMSFSMISVLRSSFAACILWFAFSYFYIKQKRWLYFEFLVFLAGLSHTSTFVFLVFPFFELMISRLSKNKIFTILIICSVSKMFLTKFLYMFVFSNINVMSDYLGYMDILDNYNLNGLIKESLLLFPAYYICQERNKLSKTDYRICNIALMYFVIRFLGLDFHGRFTVYLFIFVIFILFRVLSNISTFHKFFMLLPFLVYIIYSFYGFYNKLVEGLYTEYLEGNYLFYQTIFSENELP